MVFPQYLEENLATLAYGMTSVFAEKQVFN